MQAPIQTKNSTTETGVSHKRGLVWLNSCQVRPTRQRLILAALLVGDGKNRHVTAESLFEATSKRAESVSLATVYNTLRVFCDAGLMNEITVEGTKSYFDTRTDDHPHYYWESDGRLTDAPKEALKIDGLPEIPSGTELSRVEIVIRLRDKSEN